MITEKDLQEAIAECQGERNPNANTCIKLAAYYTILDHVKEQQEQPPGERYSFAAEPTQYQDIVTYDGESEFAQAIYERNSYDMWAVMDELMSTLSVLNPKLYNAVMRKVAE